MTTSPASSTSSEVLPEPRRLVDLEPDAVAEPVAEVLAVAAVADHRARGLVGLLAADPGPIASRPAACAARTSS